MNSSMGCKSNTFAVCTEAGEANGHSDDDAARGSDMYSSSQSADPKPEPEKIRVWREEQERMLKQKDEEEAVKREELKQQAKRELSEWKTRYAEQLEKSKKNNRSVADCPMHVSKSCVIVCLTSSNM